MKEAFYILESGIGWDTWSEDRRYYIEVKNSGRTAAQKCKAELFMVIRNENSRDWADDDSELERLHVPIGWLLLRQNTSFAPEYNKLDETRTISGKGTERLYFGSDSIESMNYSSTPTMNPENEWATPEGLKLSIPDEYYEDLANRFQNKEEFFPAHHIDLTTILSANEKVGSIRWQSSELVKAEVRVTSENTSLVEASLNMIAPDTGNKLPEFIIEETNKRNWWQNWSIG